MPASVHSPQKTTTVAALLLALILANLSFGQSPAKHSAIVTDTLDQGFLNPPNVARPRVWWHWMNGNVTEQGIDLDLDWMHRIGIGGFHVFDAAHDTPTIVDHRLIYMTPEWKHAFNHAIGKAEELGLEATIASSPGWSETGGPWVKPAQAMKKLVWSETLITGGTPFHVILSPPPTISGSFQDLGSKRNPQYYADVAVLAYPVTQSEPVPEISTSNEKSVSENVRAALADGLLAATALTLPIAKPGKTSWIQFSYAAPQSIQAMTYAIAAIPGAKPNQPNPAHVLLDRSDDGVNFTRVIDITNGQAILHTVSFPAVTARYFRVSFPTPDRPTSGDAVLSGYPIKELRLYAEPRNNDFEAKAGFTIARDYYALQPATASPGTVVPTNAVLDLTKNMSADGTLTWTPPAGEWRVLRLGYSLTGRTNHPAPPEATGLEVDELSQPDIESYLDQYFANYTDTVGKEQMGAHGIRFMLNDSTEIGPENWTNDMLAQFRELRGYDALPWLPTLTGAVIESPEATDRFLWDFRRTIAELLSSKHYDTIAKYLHARGMGYYGEALESGRPELGDDLEMRRATDIPMGAMWVMPDGGPVFSYASDLLGAASIAHVYGRNLVGAESMTSKGRPWGFAPEDIKPTADMELALGVNQFMIHESTHVPVDDKLPGLSLGHYGQMFNRNETWADQAKPWIDYLARCSYMLQQGRFFAALAYFYGEEEPLGIQYSSERGLPQENGFDFVNSDIILHELSVAHDGRLITHGGASYRVLYLGGSSRRMTVPVLRQLVKLVRDGATIAGTKPVESPSQADRPEDFHRLADELWGQGRPVASRQVGKGRVLSAESATHALHALGTPPDWSYTAKNADAQLAFIHRKLEQGDVYFVLNRKNRAEDVRVSFTETGKVPELWLPDTGEHRASSYVIADGRTSLPLKLEPNGSLFVVFRAAAKASTVKIAEPVEKPLETLDKAWEVTFESNRGAPQHATFHHLTSWSDSTDLGIRYFSGHATYEQTLTASANWFAPGSRL
jgi:hypothetical protein